MERVYEIPEGDGLRRLIRNAREEAIYDVLGGVHSAAEKLGVRRQSVHYLLTQPRIRDAATAQRLAKATAEVGRPVPVTEILDLEPWRGPERRPDDSPSAPNGTPRRGKGNAASAPPSVSHLARRAEAAGIEAKGKHTCPTCHRTACTTDSNPVIYKKVA